MFQEPHHRNSDRHVIPLTPATYVPSMRWCLFKNRGASDT